MSKTMFDERTGAADLVAEVGDRYLLLVRENYLDDPRGADLRKCLADALRRLVAANELWIASRLARSDDWREAVVGLHYVLVASLWKGLNLINVIKPLVVERYGAMLRQPGSFHQPLAIRPVFLLLVAVNCRDVVLAFLASDRPVDDLADVYAAAFVAEELTRADPADVPAVRDHVLARLRAEPWFDDGDFTASQKRFRRAWHYWTESRAEADRCVPPSAAG